MNIVNNICRSPRYYHHKSIYYDPSNGTSASGVSSRTLMKLRLLGSEDVSDGDETAVQDCVGVYCTEETGDNDIDSLPSPKLPPSNFKALNGSLTDDDNNEMQGHL